VACAHEGSLAQEGRYATKIAGKIAESADDRGFHDPQLSPIKTKRLENLNGIITPRTYPSNYHRAARKIRRQNHGIEWRRDALAAVGRAGVCSGYWNRRMVVAASEAHATTRIPASGRSGAHVILGAQARQTRV